MYQKEQMLREEKLETKDIKNALFSFAHINYVKLNISHNLFKGNLLSEHTPFTVLILIGLNVK